VIYSIYYSISTACHIMTLRSHQKMSKILGVLSLYAEGFQPKPK
jgi:hypothetical protein